MPFPALWHAYVDESGDRGWKPRAATTPPGTRDGSSRIFSMSAAIVPDGSHATILDAADVVRATLRRGPGDVLHWQNIRHHGQRRYVAETLASLDDLLVIHIVICKWHLPPNHAFANPERLYTSTFRLMIERLSWFASTVGGQVSVTLAQVRGLHPQKLMRYLDELETIQHTCIDWGSLKGPLKVNTPANCRLLQIADLTSGACYAAFNPDDFGYTEPAYLQAMKARIWRRSQPHLLNDGLKIVPWPHQTCEAGHRWIADFCRT